MRKKIYLWLAGIIVGLLILVIVVPYVGAYLSYSHGYKGFMPGSRITYVGEMDFFITRDKNNNIVKVVLDTSLYYTLSIEYSKPEKIIVNLNIYNNSKELKKLIFSKSLIFDKNVSLIKFLFPSSTKLSLNKDLQLFICKYPGSIWSSSSLGMPTRLGVPREYLGILIIDRKLLVSEMPPLPKQWNKCIASLLLDNMSRVGEFFEYGRLKNGYILLSYTAYYDTDINGNPVAADVFKKYGSPLMDLIIASFGVPILKNIKNIIKKDPNLTVRIARERILLLKSNTYPTDQAWLDGIVSAYMALTPFSQLLTVLALIFIVLYYRE